MNVCMYVCMHLYMHIHKQCNAEGEIGCGNGRNMTYPGINFKGVDACDRLAEARHKNGLNARKGSMLNILLPNATVDYIICVAAFRHLNTLGRCI